MLPYTWLNESISPSKEASTNAFILDPRKSQNTAIVLKSLAVSRKEIVDALIDGQGLNADTIEKLSRIAPTEEEQSHILEYEGDTTKLAAAESFLLNYDSEIKEIGEILQTLEMACTNRGNAQAFNLVSLRKLSDVKSVDGKTTLPHFVVEEVVRSKGKHACGNDKGGKFVREMNHFLENYEKDLQLVREEETRIMQLVKRTTYYYQRGGSKGSAGEQTLYLFVIVKDFLGMVDQA
ncbi:hypothetical protein KIW84_042267 [Lathyrus oleraceus]|uniref:Formin-like protein n=1 Tax=Pisum sativum TaxID=3888 RepID=A0A9D5ASV1_PEA|nr:hypothetical protein KIW84_042267 [Pisum sativum]